MSSLIYKVRNHRFGLIALLAFCFIGISLLTRMILFFSSQRTGELTLFTILESFFVGFFFDLVTSTYFIIPLLVYLWLCPEWLFRKRWHGYVLNLILFFFLLLLIFDSISEWFFWEEFTTRFNFIAVDYLVYTTEVIGNIRQSYPVEWFVAVALALTTFIVYQLRSWTIY